MQEIDIGVSKIPLPIHDEKEQKRLKLEFEEIIGVYFDVEGEAEIYDKNEFTAGILIDMIETCESRLKLKWIPGKEGISNEFQVMLLSFRS